MRMHLLLTLVAWSLCLLGGCAGGRGGSPSATITNAKLAGLTFDGVRIDFDVNIKNPSSRPLGLDVLQYQFLNKDTGEEAFLEGSLTDNISSQVVGPRSSRSLRVPATLSFPQLLEALDQGRLGSIVSYRANLQLMTLPQPTTAAAGSQTPAPLSLPMSWDGKFPIPNIPQIELVNLTWDDMGLISLRGKAIVRVTNTNEFDIDIRKFAYKVQLQGATLMSGGLSSGALLRPGQTREIEIPLRLSMLKLGAAVMDAARSNVAAYRIKGDARVVTEFGDLSFPFEESGK